MAIAVSYRWVNPMQGRRYWVLGVFLALLGAQAFCSSFYLTTPGAYKPLGSTFAKNENSKLFLTCLSREIDLCNVFWLVNGERINRDNPQGYVLDFSRKLILGYFILRPVSASDNHTLLECRAGIEDSNGACVENKALSGSITLIVQGPLAKPGDLTVYNQAATLLNTSAYGPQLLSMTSQVILRWQAPFTFDLPVFREQEIINYRITVNSENQLLLNDTTRSGTDVIDTEGEFKGAQGEYIYSPDQEYDYTILQYNVTANNVAGSGVPATVFAVTMPQNTSLTVTLFQGGNSDSFLQLDWELFPFILDQDKAINLSSERQECRWVLPANQAEGMNFSLNDTLVTLTGKSLEPETEYSLIIEYAEYAGNQTENYSCINLPEFAPTASSTPTTLTVPTTPTASNTPTTLATPKRPVQKEFPEYSDSSHANNFPLTSIVLIPMVALAPLICMSIPIGLIALMRLLRVSIVYHPPEDYR